jgi:hypothetical protein
MIRSAGIPIDVTSFCGLRLMVSTMTAGIDLARLTLSVASGGQLMTFWVAGLRVRD